MKITYSRSVAEQKKDFLFSYYHYPVLWFQRRFLGPFILVLSPLLLFASYKSEASFLWYLYDLLIVALGMYHLFRPRIISNKMRFEEDEKTEITLSDEVFVLKGRQVDIRMNRSDILGSRHIKNYLLLKVRINRVLYFFLNLDRIGKKEEFLENLECFLNPSEPDPTRKTEDPPEDSRSKDQSV